MKLAGLVLRLFAFVLPKCLSCGKLATYQSMTRCDYCDRCAEYWTDRGMPMTEHPYGPAVRDLENYRGE